MWPSPSIEELLKKYKHDPRLLYTKVCKKYNVKADPAAGWVPCAAFTLGTCLKGSSCSYLHEEGAEGTKAFKATALFSLLLGSGSLSSTTAAAPIAGTEVLGAVGGV